MVDMQFVVVRDAVPVFVTQKFREAVHFADRHNLEYFFSLSPVARTNDPCIVDGGTLITAYAIHGLLDRLHGQDPEVFMFDYPGTSLIDVLRFGRNTDTLAKLCNVIRTAVA